MCHLFASSGHYIHEHSPRTGPNWKHDLFRKPVPTFRDHASARLTVIKLALENLADRRIEKAV
ncbi:MAG: hypothetical protein WAV27_17705, partial [Xanthobacteraceae bacterium]